MTGISQRQSNILNPARISGRVTVEDLTRRFEVSTQALRTQVLRKDLDDEGRRVATADGKKAIGVAAAVQTPNGCSLFSDGRRRGFPATAGQES